MEAHPFANMIGIAANIKARNAAKAAAASLALPQPAVSVPSLDVLHAELAKARAGFDPAYEQCDDYSEWTRQAAKAHNIRTLTAMIAARGEA